jgi:hypothetical protein
MEGIQTGGIADGRRQTVERRCASRRRHITQHTAHRPVAPLRPSQTVPFFGGTFPRANNRTGLVGQMKAHLCWILDVQFAERQQLFSPRMVTVDHSRGVIDPASTCAASEEAPQTNSGYATCAGLRRSAPPAGHPHGTAPQVGAPGQRIQSYLGRDRWRFATRVLPLADADV